MLRLHARAAVHVQGQAAQNTVGFVVLAQLQNAFGIPFKALGPDGFHRLGRQVQGVGDGHADTLVADVQANHPHDSHHLYAKLGAFPGAVSAEHALFLVHDGVAVDDFDGVLPAPGGAASAALAPVVHHHAPDPVA